MTEQHKYYTLTEDVKTLIQYAKNHAIDHPVVKAANRLNWAIKKGLRDYGIPVTPIKESKDSFEEEKLQYAEDCKTHEKPWELWQYAMPTHGVLDWIDFMQHPVWSKYCIYRRKPTTFNIEYYSGLNCKDAEHLIGKVVEGTNYPNEDWKTVKLINITNGKQRSGVFEVYHQKEPGVTGTYEYIRTVEEILVPEHPTINIGGTELPMPEPFALAHGTKYWVFPYPAHRELFRSLHWSYSRSDIDALQAGQVHLTEERAKAWADWWKKGVLAKIDETTS